MEQNWIRTEAEVEVEIDYIVYADPPPQVNKDLTVQLKRDL